MGVWLIWTLILSYVAGEKIPVLLIWFYCTQHHFDLSFPILYLPSILSACPWVTYSYWNSAIRILGKLRCVFFLPFWNLPSYQIHPVFPYCVQTMGRKESAWKIWSFHKQKKDEKGPFFLTYPILLKKLGYKRVRDFLFLWLHVSLQYWFILINHGF